MNKTLLRELELADNLKMFLDILEKENDLDCELAVKRIFYKWRVLHDPYFAFKGHDFESTIKLDFKKYSVKYSECSLFQFYIGIVMWIEPWSPIPLSEYSENMEYYDKLGKLMIKKASLLSPETKLYQYYSSDNKETRKQLLKEFLLDKDYPLKGGEIQHYFERILEATRKDYDI